MTLPTPYDHHKANSDRLHAELESVRHGTLEWHDLHRQLSATEAHIRLRPAPKKPTRRKGK